ncbi:darcynin family protein [Streptomyces varsoviensis]|uniref:darcynin family protein n=1 Tax=Streptomyces varsoviensis TaxID=67373 RepID=UPI000A4FC463|nr:darcynin family protein [Streptomyces varsoviensis]
MFPLWQLDDLPQDEGTPIPTQEERTMAADQTTPPVTAFMLIKTMPEWLAMTPEERATALSTEVMPAVKAKTTGVRSRFYDTEFYSTRVTDVWVWEAEDHNAYQLLIDALRETPFWDRYFQVVDLLVGTENGYARTYNMDPVASITT